MNLNQPVLKEAETRCLLPSRSGESEQAVADFLRSPVIQLAFRPHQKAENSTHPSIPFQKGAQLFASRP